MRTSYSAMDIGSHGEALKERSPSLWAQRRVSLGKVAIKGPEKEELSIPSSPKNISRVVASCHRKHESYRQTAFHSEITNGMPSLTGSECPLTVSRKEMWMLSLTGV